MREIMMSEIKKNDEKRINQNRKVRAALLTQMFNENSNPKRSYLNTVS